MRITRARRRARRGAGAGWRQVRPGLHARVYASEAVYREHQASKLATLDPVRMAVYDEQFREALLERLAGRAVTRPGLSVVCLGARTGAEVVAFLHLGSVAYGIDLQPASPLVIKGDFHRIAQPDESFDVVYTNSLDHAFDLGRVLSEVRRILRPSGLFVCEASSKPPGEFEALAWDRIDDLLAHLEAGGFRLLQRLPIDVPWKGEQLLMVRA